MIKAILWDFGGVFTTSPFEAFNRFEAERGLPRDFIRGINATNPDTNAWAQFESSEVTVDQFDELFRAEARALGHPVGGQEVLELLSGDLRPRMVRVLETCKAHYDVACITNNMKQAGDGPSMAKDPDRAAAAEQVMALFDFVIESSVVGIRKPNPRIYEIACERLGVLADEVVFLDDLGVNLKPARAMGMQTIKVLGESQAIDDLAKVTGIEFPA